MKIPHFTQNLPKLSMECTQNSVYNAQVSVYRTQKTHLPILIECFYYHVFVRLSCVCLIMMGLLYHDVFIIQR